MGLDDDYCLEFGGDLGCDIGFHNSYHQSLAGIFYDPNVWIVDVLCRRGNASRNNYSGEPAGSEGTISGLIDL